LSLTEHLGKLGNIEALPTTVGIFVKQNFSIKAVSVDIEKSHLEAKST
jgi:hypothetical protein